MVLSQKINRSFRFNLCKTGLIDTMTMIYRRDLLKLIVTNKLFHFIFEHKLYQNRN